MRAVLFAVKMAVARRFHTHNVLRQETLGHHSHGVAVLLHILRPDASKELLVAALLHDLAEGEFGDLPGPTKRLLGIREQVAALEARELLDNDLPMPPLTTEETAALKFADAAHGSLYCLEELRRGNVDLRKPLRNFVSWLRPVLDSELELTFYISKEAEKYEDDTNGR